MGSNKKQQPELWENVGNNHKFTRLFNSQLESPAMKKLNGRQRALYLYMKAQYKGAETKGNPNGVKNQFYFNWGLVNKKGYALYTNQNTFYKDIKKLEELGFIKCIERNSHTRKKNIYAFSDEWKNIQ